MPANLIHCMSCRALLNLELESDSVEIPMFVPLQEIECVIDLKPRGYFLGCPHCDKELRVNAKYLGETVGCKWCNGKFQLDLKNPAIETQAYYGDCPYCQKELRVGKKYVGMKVACKFCGGKIKVVE